MSIADDARHSTAGDVVRGGTFGEAVPCGSRAPGLIYELRTYSFRPGGVGQYVQLLQETGMVELLAPHLVGFWQFEEGRLNRATHLWAYADRQHRHDVRARNMADPRWAEFAPRAGAMLLEQQSGIYVGDVHWDGQTTISDGAWYERIVVSASPEGRDGTVEGLRAWHPAVGGSREFPVALKNERQLSDDQVVLARFDTLDARDEWWRARAAEDAQRSPETVAAIVEAALLSAVDLIGR